jgi:hypothetical protein
MGLREAFKALFKKTQRVKKEVLTKTRKAKVAKKKVSTAETRLTACKEEVTLAKQKALRADADAKEALRTADATVKAMSKTAQKEIADTKKTAKSLISLKIKRPTRKVVVQPAAPAPVPAQVSAPLPPL